MSWLHSMSWVEDTNWIDLHHPSERGGFRDPNSGILESISSWFPYKVWDLHTHTHTHSN